MKESKFRQTIQQHSELFIWEMKNSKLRFLNCSKLTSFIFNKNLMKSEEDALTFKLSKKINKYAACKASDLIINKLWLKSISEYTFINFRKIWLVNFQLIWYVNWFMLN